MNRAWLVLAILSLAACKERGGSEPKAGPAKPATIDLQGAGATFPYPLYSKWMAEYGTAHPSIRINYQSIGSGGGIRQITERTVDFGASDAPMTDGELAKAPGKLLHIPVTMGAVAVTYNLPSLGESQLRLSPEVLAAIFLGEIQSWDDPRLVALNPGVKLPSKPITLVVRSDGSGTTAAFTDYLAQVSPAWKEKAGAGKSVKFPAGLGAKGNEGVSGQVKSSPGALGYVELAYAKQNKMPTAELQNRAGKLVAPSMEAVSAAAAAFTPQLPEDLRVSIVNAPGEQAYPIASFSYILLYEEQPEPEKGRALVDFLWWATHEGQRFSSALDYAPLPPEVVQKVEAKLRGVRSQGKALAPGA